MNFLINFGNIFKPHFQKFLIMSDKLKAVKSNANVVKESIEHLKTELKVLTEAYNNILLKDLLEENATLTKAVEAAKKQLIQIETQNGVKQIPIPNSQAAVKSVPIQPYDTEPKVEKPISSTKVEAPKENKPKKEKKAKEPKETPAELPIDFGRLDLRIAKIEDVQRHPDADTLYLLKIHCGEDKPRTVCSGLVKHVNIEDLRDRTVVLLCNLKPVKMRGITSEAMVMCASSEQGVEVLIPPPNCQPGDLVHCDGYNRQPDAIMNPKKKIFETVAPDLHTNDSLEACYKGVVWNVPGKGHIVAKSLRNVPVK